MKKLFISIFALAGLFSSCENDMEPLGENFVAFTNPGTTTVGIPEDYASTNQVYNLEVGIAQLQNSDVTVNLAIEEITSVEGVNFNIPSTVTIPAGERYALVPIQPLDDNVDLYSTTFEVSISSNSANTSNGFADLGSYHKTVTIIDCPTKFGFWLGALDYTSSGSEGSSGTVEGRLTDNSSCDLLIIDADLSGLAAFGDADGNTLNTFEFTPTNDSGTLGSVDVRTYLGKIALTSGDYDCYFESNDGSYNASTGIFTVDYAVNAYDSDNSLLGALDGGTLTVSTTN